MKTSKLPKTDSILKLAKFWDTHELTNFEDELEEVSDPVFVRATPIKVRLQASETKALLQLAHKKGISEEELIRKWVLQKLASGGANRRGKRRSRLEAHVKLSS